MAEAQELPDRLSRREFLHVSGMGLLALAVPAHWGGRALDLPVGQLGRVADATVDVYRQASFAGERLHTFWRDDVLALDRAVVGDEVPEHNRVWYHVADMGFVHSSPVQPVLDQPNQPLETIAYDGQLMEVSVPFADIYWRPRTDAERAYRFYYGTTHWIDGVSRDVRGHRWYRIQDDKWTFRYFGPAEAFRPVPAPEVTPISPDVPLEEKRVVVDLTHQWVQCYEASQLVFTAKISSGEQLQDGTYRTPLGEYVTFRKRHSRHMAAGNLAAGYDLPGVPWVVYITEDGVSFHGTYWHNDFGRPRSHGCINMSPQAAKWLFRWTQPVVPWDEQEVEVNYGTRVQIVT